MVNGHADCRLRLDRDFESVSPDATYGVLWALPRACWIAFLVLMLIWIVHTQHGFAFAKTMMGSQGFLSYHYVFMTVAWPICMFEAIFSYRAPLYKLPHRKSVIPITYLAHKYLHVALQTASGIFIILGLVFVGLFKRYNGEAQFFSVHSWLGAIAIAAYIAQYTAGFWAYLVSRWSPQRKAAFYLVHRLLGSACLLTAFAAILAGLQEVQIFDMWFKYGIKGFDGATAYSMLAIFTPIMALLILIQALVIVFHLVHGQQAIPISRGTGPAGAVQEARGNKSSLGENGVITLNAL